MMSISLYINRCLAREKNEKEKVCVDVVVKSSVYSLIGLVHSLKFYNTQSK